MVAVTHQFVRSGLTIRWLITVNLCIRINHTITFLYNFTELRNQY